MDDIAPPAAAADLALPWDSVTGRGTRLSRAPAAVRYSLRARSDAVLATSIGRALPDRIGAVRGGIARLGPDEYYALLPAGDTLPAAAGQAVSVVDISARALGFVIEGPGAAERIASGCSLDLDRFAIGRATRTLFETVEIILFRDDDERFCIDVWRSFAPWLWHVLAAEVAAAD